MLCSLLTTCQAVSVNEERVTIDLGSTSHSVQLMNSLLTLSNAGTAARIRNHVRRYERVLWACMSGFSGLHIRAARAPVWWVASTSKSGRTSTTLCSLQVVCICSRVRYDDYYCIHANTSPAALAAVLSATCSDLDDLDVMTWQVDQLSALLLSLGL